MARNFWLAVTHDGGAAAVDGERLKSLGLVHITGPLPSILGICSGQLPSNSGTSHNNKPAAHAITHISAVAPAPSIAPDPIQQ